jgi:integrase/recombinase XerD
MEKGLSQNSLDAYGRDLADFQVFTHPLTHGTLPKAEVLQSYVNYLYRKNLSSRSIARRLSAVRNLFHFLVADGRLTSDPTQHLASPKQWATIPRFLNRGQIEKLIQAPDTSKPIGLRDRAMLELLYATGIRVSELIALRTSNLDAGLGVIRVTGKGNKQRLIPVHSTALKSIADYAEHGRPFLLKGRATHLIYSLRPEAVQ